MTFPLRQSLFFSEQMLPATLCKSKSEKGRRADAEHVRARATAAERNDIAALELKLVCKHAAAAEAQARRGLVEYKGSDWL